MNKQTKAQYRALPKSVKIGQRDYQIVLSSEDVDAGLQSAYGYTMTKFDTIVLADNMSAGKLRSTFLHEILHAIGMTANNPMTEVPEKHKGESYEDYADRWEHFHIHLLAEPLVQLLQDNPPLVAFLTLANKQA